MSELQLEQYFNNRRIIDATMRQLEKDFSLDEDSVQLKDYQGICLSSCLKLFILSSTS
ncbi:MAG: hypothetical protein IPG89_05350 [Bacteroidetes bacterium]|nr:hypothetical protein [Bacteroidota bacterium]